MRINNNLMAMNTHRQLGLNNAAGAKSIEKLSSGLKINRAGDDAAGLAISEKMRSQIRGLNMASKNSQDGISLIQTAEGALNETHAILQRMRELAVQSSNDTNVTIDRGEIQKEMNQLSSEVNRIAGTTEFNTMKLLNGDRAITTAQSSVTTTVVALGSGVITVPNAIASYTITDANSMGPKISNITVDTATATSDFGAAFSADGSGVITITKSSGGTVTVTLKSGSAGSTLQFSALDTLATNAGGDYVYNNHGVSFTIAAADYAAMATGSITIDGISAGGTLAIVDQWASNNSGQATITSGFTIAKTADNANVRAVRVVQTATKLEVHLLDSTSTTGGATAIHTDVFDLTGDGTAINYNDHGITFTYTSASAGGTASAQFTLASLVSSDSTTVTNTVTISDKSMKFQVGANQSQQMNLDIADMRAAALKATSSTAGSQSVTVGTASVTAYYVSSKNVTDGTSSTNSEYALDVSDASKAGAAITVINAAIENVSGERSKLGAVQNRLEHTIKNLDTSAENLQAAESRIRDVDMAKEMMNLTKNNILQQAAQAMLAQANQAPQGVLQLLR